MGSEEGAKSGIHLAILTFITVLTHPDLYRLARYSEWWPLYNQRSYYYHSTSVFCLFYQHAAQDIDIYFPESLLSTGQGLKEQGSWKSIQMEAEDTPWMCLSKGWKEVGLRLTRHPFQRLRKFGAKIWVLNPPGYIVLLPRCVEI